MFQRPRLKAGRTLTFTLSIHEQQIWLFGFHWEIYYTLCHRPRKIRNILTSFFKVTLWLPKWRSRFRPWKANSYGSKRGHDLKNLEAIYGSLLIKQCNYWDVVLFFFRCTYIEGFIFSEGTSANGRKPSSRGNCPPVLDRTRTVEKLCDWSWSWCEKKLVTLQ